MHAETPTKNLANELARERNRQSADRTLMAWVRTGPSRSSVLDVASQIFGYLAHVDNMSVGWSWRLS